MIYKYDQFLVESYKIHAHISNNSNPDNIIEKKITFTKKAFDEFNEVIEKHKNEYKKMLSLIKELSRNPDFWKPETAGLGKSERLKGNGHSSKRISKKIRLEYRATEDEIKIFSCIDHYGSE